MLKISLLFKNLQNPWANSLRIHADKKAKLSGFCFCMNTNMSGSFQIYISVLLMWALL